MTNSVVAPTDVFFSGRVVRMLAPTNARMDEVFVMLLDPTVPVDKFPVDRTRLINEMTDVYEFFHEPKIGASVVYERRVASHLSADEFVERCFSGNRVKAAVAEIHPSLLPPLPNGAPRQIGPSQEALNRIAGYRGIADPLSDAWFNASTGGTWCGGRMLTKTEDSFVETVLFFPVLGLQDPQEVFAEARAERARQLGGASIASDPATWVTSTPQTPTWVFTLQRRWQGDVATYVERYIPS